MPVRPFRPNEVSSGGVVVRGFEGAHQVCLVCDGRYWGLPKGHVEAGETPEVAALREISEETGIPLQQLRVVATLAPSEYTYRRRDTGRLVFKRVHQFLVEATADSELHPDPAEIAEAAWLSFDEARERASFRDTSTALDAAHRLLQKEDRVVRP